MSKFGSLIQLFLSKKNQKKMIGKEKRIFLVSFENIMKRNPINFLLGYMMINVGKNAAIWCHLHLRMARIRQIRISHKVPRKKLMAKNLSEIFMSLHDQMETLLMLEELAIYPIR